MVAFWAFGIGDRWRGGCFGPLAGFGGAAAAAASAAFLAAWRQQPWPAFGLFGLFRSSRSRLNSKRSLAWSAAFFTFARPDFTLGEAEILDQRDARRADEGAAAAFDAIEDGYSCVLPKFLAREEPVHLERLQFRAGRPGRRNRSGCTVFPAPWREQAVEWAIRQLVALTTGTWGNGRKPIIGPPIMPVGVRVRRGASAEHFVHRRADQDFVVARLMHVAGHRDQARDDRFAVAMARQAV